MGDFGMWMFFTVLVVVLNIEHIAAAINTINL